VGVKPPVAGDKPPTIAALKPTTFGAKPPVVVEKPAVVVSEKPVIAPAPELTVEEPAEDAEDGDDKFVSLDGQPVSAPLSNLTKGRPKIPATSRRPPSVLHPLEKSNIYLEESSEPARASPGLAPPPSVPKPAGPVAKPTPKASGTFYYYFFFSILRKTCCCPVPGENATLQELRKWMVAEVEALREELQEEKSKRQALETRLAALEK